MYPRLIVSYSLCQWQNFKSHGNSQQPPSWPSRFSWLSRFSLPSAARLLGCELWHNPRSCPTDFIALIGQPNGNPCRRLSEVKSIAKVKIKTKAAKKKHNKNTEWLLCKTIKQVGQGAQYIEQGLWFQHGFSNGTSKQEIANGFQWDHNFQPNHEELCWKNVESRMLSIMALHVKPKLVTNYSTLVIYFMLHTTRVSNWKLINVYHLVLDKTTRPLSNRLCFGRLFGSRTAGLSLPKIFPA